VSLVKVSQKKCVLVDLFTSHSPFYFANTAIYKQLYVKYRTYTFSYIFYLGNFSITHLYWGTRGEIGREWTALKWCDIYPVDWGRLDLDIGLYRSPRIGVPNSNWIQKSSNFRIFRQKNTRRTENVLELRFQNVLHVSYFATQCMTH
jgi:hypothetical protein